MADFLSYSANVNHEDLLDIYKLLDPTEVWLQSYAGTEKITSDKPEWPIVALDTPASNKVIQGADVTAAGSDPASRAHNHTQTSRKTVAISDSQEAMNSAAGVDSLVKQKARKLRALVGDMELALLCNTAGVAGTSAVEGEVNGVCGFITTNAFTGASGGISETDFNSLIELVWKSGGEVANIVAGSTHCSSIDGFDGNNTKMSLMDAKGALNASIKVYITRYGRAVIVPHRLMESTRPKVVLALGESSYWKIAWLRKPAWQKLGKKGPTEREFIESEYSLIAFNEASSGKFSAT